MKKALLEAATVIKGGVSGGCPLMLSGPTSEVRREVSLGISSSSGSGKHSTSHGSERARRSNGAGCS